MKWRAAAQWTLALGLVAAPGSPAPCQSRDERAVRAAYVYNLLQYVDWPGEKSDFVLCFEGDAPEGEILRTLVEGRSSNGRRIHVVLFPRAPELQACSVFYLGDDPIREGRGVPESLRDRTVLTVGESEPFVRNGGMVALINTGGHIRIEVNLDATQRVGIRISSRVLNLATIVHSEQNGGR